MSSALETMGMRPGAAPRPRLNPLPSPKSARKVPRSPLFDAADQDRVRADLATFFGPRADVYLATYEKMRNGPPRAIQRTWSWPVFLGSFTWFFYRKLYGLGAVALFLPMVLGYLFGQLGGGATVVLAMGAKGWYVNIALARIAKADEQRLAGPERDDYLRRAGGVSLAAGLLAGFVYVGLLVLLSAAIVMRRHHVGH